jgi:hypothetical protein
LIALIIELFVFLRKKMALLTEDIKKLSAPQKAELYCLLRDDEELKNYIISNKMLFEELIRRDKAYADGKYISTTRQQLSSRLKNRRNAL